jgi:hypothetical protein
MELHVIKGSDLERLLAKFRVLYHGAEMLGAVKGTETPLPSYEGADPDNRKDKRTKIT